MKVKDMIAGLKAMEEMLSNWSASAQASKDINRIIELMSQDEDLSVAQFCAKIEKALDGKDPTATPASRTRANNTARADEYIEQIRSPELTRSDLTEIVKQLKQDKKCRIQELDYIANTLTQSGRKYRNKTHAIQDIERYAQQRLNVSRRMEDTSGIF